MAKDAVDSRFDMSAGDSPPQSDSTLANDVLADSASRRRYRRFSFVLAVTVVLALGFFLWKLICAASAFVTAISPWVVGMVATLVVAIAVITLALLKATFAAPGNGEVKDAGNMPQASLLSDALKALSDAIGALREAVGK